MKKTVFVLISMLILFFFQLSNYLYSANVLNPSFEDDLNHWTKEGTPSTIIGSSNYAHDGSYSCLFDNPTTAYSLRGISSQLVTITVGNSYNIYGWFFVEYTAGAIEATDFRLRVVWLNSVQSELSSSPSSTGWQISSFGTWEKKEFSNLIAPENAVYAKLLIECKETVNNNNDAYIDDFFIDGDSTVPITLSTFTAQYLNDTPTLCWTTQSETNNAGWNIYRGETNDALSNEEAYQLNLSLGLIPGAGTTSELTDYSFDDVFPVFQETTYFYWLESVDYSGETESFGPISLTIPENEWENPNSPEIPKNYGLYQNYPNPFNPSTEISFIMKENCIAELSVYNIKGEKITTLFQNKSISKDELIRINWNGEDDFGKAVSSGIYLYKLRTNKENFVRKMILMK